MKVFHTIQAQCHCWQHCHTTSGNCGRYRELSFCLHNMYSTILVALVIAAIVYRSVHVRLFVVLLWCHVSAQSEQTLLCLLTEQLCLATMAMVPMFTNTTL